MGKTYNAICLHCYRYFPSFTLKRKYCCNACKQSEYRDRKAGKPKARPPWMAE